jgi:hypothetical protein
MRGVGRMVRGWVAIGVWVFVRVQDVSVNLGVVMLRDTQPELGEDTTAEVIHAPVPGESSDGTEPEPPEPFEIIIDDE